MKNKRIQSYIIGGMFSVFLTIGFVLLAVPGLNKRTVETQKMYSVNSSTFTKIINFPQLGDYIIKIKYNFKNTDTDVAILNGEKLELRISNNSDVIRTRYYYAPKEIIKEGKNFLKINFYPSNPFNIDLRIRNYIASTADGNIILALKNSAIRKRSLVSILIIGVIFFVFSFGLWILWGYLGKLMNLSGNQVLFNNILSFLPWAGVYFILGLVSGSTPFSLAVSPSYLFGLLFFGTLISNIFLNLLAVYFSMRAGSSPVSKSKGKDYRIPEWLYKSFLWIKSKEFSDKCILFFMFLLIMCAFLLILGMEWLAEQFANVAYFALVVGVVIKFIKFVREK